MQREVRIGVDLAKSVFEIAVSQGPGRVAERHRVPRSRFRAFFVNRPAATVILEACGSAHYWARELQALGHQVVLLPPHQVRPYVPRNKTDRTDALGLLEAARNADIHPVPVKSVDQQVLISLHRLRSAWVAERTAKLNTLRGLLRELGIFIPVGARAVVPHTWAALEDAESGVPDALRGSLAAVCDEIRALDERIKQVERELDALAAQSPLLARLRSIPGVGLMTSTALVATVGDAQRFPSGRHFASYLGLTPREYSSGGRRRLGRISKRGDSYLRMLLIHGARAVLWHAKRLRQPDRLRAWALRLEASVGHNKAAVALANKLACTVWAVWTRDCSFEPVEAAA